MTGGLVITSTTIPSSNPSDLNQPPVFEWQVQSLETTTKNAITANLFAVVHVACDYEWTEDIAMKYMIKRVFEGRHCSPNCDQELYLTTTT